MKRIVLIPDTHVPIDDRSVVRAIIRFIGNTQPDEVVHLGDLMDYPSPSRWTKGTKEEFQARIKPDSEQAKTRFLGPLREVYSGPVRVHVGNHDERPETYLGQYAPALVEYAEQFKLSALLDFDGFGVETLPDFYKIAPGWLSTHGHRGGIRLSQKSGETALLAALKFGTSVIMGHVHRLGLKGHTTGYGGNGNTLWGMEIGHIMNMKKAHYLKGATANWQQGFGLLTVDGAHVKPELVPINARRFSVDGSSWVL